MSTHRTTYDGARIYGRLLLAVYDFLVMHILTRFVWRCSARNYLVQYKQHISANHADIGVGTSFVLNQLIHLPNCTRIALFDLQQHCLRFSARRLARFKPEFYQCDVLAPERLCVQPFDSIALGGLLHCLPGDMREKSAVFKFVRSLSNNNAIVFGYTILNRDVEKTRLSKAVYFILQKLKVINGVRDSASQLQRELRKYFIDCKVEIIGCVALFSARVRHLN